MSWRCFPVFLSLALGGPAMAQSELVARLVPGADPVVIGAVHGCPLQDRTFDGPFALFTVPAGTDPHAAQASFLSDPAVVWCEDNIEMQSAEGQSAIKGSTLPAIGGRSALYAANTHVLEQINWSSSLAATKGRTVRIAILDTGLSMGPFVTRSQNYLWDKVDASANFVEPGQKAIDMPRREDSNGNGVPDEEVGHGTMIAGIIDQIAPQTRFVIARIADSDGVADAWSLIKGLSFAVANGAEVANVSLGAPDRVPALSDVLEYCEANRLLVVSGAGNANRGSAFFPAAYSKAVCVGGLEPDNRKASFSNWDSAVRSSAPATGIVSQWWNGHLGIWSGTSFSSPMVAGAIADCLRRNSGTPPLSDIRTWVKDSGRDLDAANPNYRGKLGTLLDIQALNRLMNP